MISGLLRVSLAVVCLAAGCRGAQRLAGVCDPIPHENQGAAIPEYVCRPPDVLAIDIEPVAGGGKTLRPGDEVLLVIGSDDTRFAEDATVVAADGTLTLPILESRDNGTPVGGLPPVKVDGLTTLGARQKILAALKGKLTKPLVQINTLAAPSLSGLYLVRPDGRIKLGRFGVFAATGLTPSQIEQNVKARARAETGVADIRVSVDVQAYNSSVYYVIADGGGLGDQMQILPKTGRDTVLDVVGEIGGLPQNAGKTTLWISRPIAGPGDRAVILPVDWAGITKRGAQSTNYEMLPGDRLYIKADRSLATDTALAKFLGPIERIFGTVSLGAVTQGSASGRLNGGAAGGS